MSTASAGLRFASVVLDVDSTLTAIEGIEWSAARRSPDIQRRVNEMTHRAMEGTAPLESVYGERLALVRPRRDDVAALAGAYQQGVSPGAAEAIAALRAHGVEIAVVSGGLREAVVPFAAALGVGEANVHAVSVHFTRPVTTRASTRGRHWRDGVASPLWYFGWALPSRSWQSETGVPTRSSRP